MKKTTIALFGCTAFLMGVAFAHEHEEFEAWMKQTNANFSSLQKTVAAKNGQETVAAADKLAELYDHVRAHFEDDKLADGVKLAKTGHDTAKDLAAVAKSGEWDKAAADLKTIGGTCQTCHAAHRVKKADGTYEMK